MKENTIKKCPCCRSKKINTYIDVPKQEKVIECEKCGFINKNKINNINT